MDEHIAEQFAIRDRFMKAVYARMSREERLEQFCAHQQSSMRLLRGSQDGYRRFLRRNFRERAARTGDDRASGT